MKPRSLTFDEARLMPTIGREVWPRPKRQHETEHYKRCFQLVQEEAERNANYRIKMSVDHISKKIKFFYSRKDPLEVRMQRMLKRGKRRIMLRKSRELFTMD